MIAQTSSPGTAFRKADIRQERSKYEETDFIPFDGGLHVPLLLSPDGRRLSKRDGDLSLDFLLARRTPADIIGKLAYLAGLNPTAGPRTPESLLPDFSWEKVPKADIFVPEELFS